MPRKSAGWVRALGAFAGIGTMLALTTGLGVWLGYTLDQRWGTSPWLTVLGLFLGMGAGFAEMFRLLKRFGND